ncbi:MAG TPA: hypothetical protein VGR51_09765 [Thermoplasmata archaeon]|jgi:hypothetical protein|nr:hypothetical protein [Thermoplasmata archaeon]
MARKFDARALGVSFPRKAPIRMYPFTQFFKGFENVEAVRKTFGPRTKQILETVKVEFFSSRWGYMGVSDEDGHLICSAHYLKVGNPRDIYLDVVHELVHVKQHRDGRPLFHSRWEYQDRPTEIEAYKVCTEEGRRLGMSDRELVKYLKVPWLDDGEFRRLAKNLGLTVPKARKKKR